MRTLASALVGFEPMNRWAVALQSLMARPLSTPATLPWAASRRCPGATLVGQVFASRGLTVGIAAPEGLGHRAPLYPQLAKSPRLADADQIGALIALASPQRA